MPYRIAPSFIMDTAAAAERKRRAIACYASPVTHDPNGVSTLPRSPRWIEATEACDRLYGSMIGVSHGELLQAPNARGLVDPVAHFRHNGCSEAPAFEGVR
jgi:hypothetical protein